MAREYEPVAGQWYENIDENESFRVLSVDEDAELVELEYLDGDSRRSIWRPGTSSTSRRSTSRKAGRAADEDEEEEEEEEDDDLDETWDDDDDEDDEDWDEDEKESDDY